MNAPGLASLLIMQITISFFYFEAVAQIKLWYVKYTFEIAKQM